MRYVVRAGVVVGHIRYWNGRTWEQDIDGAKRYRSRGAAERFAKAAHLRATREGGMISPKKQDWSPREHEELKPYFAPVEIGMGKVT